MHEENEKQECGAGVSPAFRKTRRNLPHWFLDGATYFVTFRLADSMPREILDRWRREQAEWLQDNPPPRTRDQEAEFQNLFNRKRQAWLDAGHGSCVLKRPELALMVSKALLHFDGVRYDMGDFVIMPNHVHLLVTPRPGFELSSILHSWKSFTSRNISKQLERTGTLWQDESYDHIVRSAAQLHHYRCYIAENPIKGRLREGEYLLHVSPYAADDRKG